MIDIGPNLKDVLDTLLMVIAAAVMYYFIFRD